MHVYAYIICVELTYLQYDKILYIHIWLNYCCICMYKVKNIILVGCGGAMELLAFMQPEDDAVFYVLDRYCVCVCVCVHACVHACVCVCMHACVCVLYILYLLCTYIHVHMPYMCTILCSLYHICSVNDLWIWRTSTTRTRSVVVVSATYLCCSVLFNTTISSLPLE